MESVGIDIGSLFVKVIVLRDEERIRASDYRPHNGYPAKALRESIQALGLADSCYVGLVGTGARAIADQLGIEIVNLVRAQIRAVLVRFPDAVNIVDIGGSTLSLIQLDQNGAVQDFKHNSLCAAGTGSFLDEQMQRLNLGYDDLENLVIPEHPPAIATRCAVFAKSDLVHRQQQGYTWPEMWAGLCEGMAATVLQALFQGRPIREKTVLIGGVAQNPFVLKKFKEMYEAFISSYPDAHMAGAEGAASLARESGIGKEVAWTTLEDRFARTESPQWHKPLELKRSTYPDFKVHASHIDEARNEVRISVPLRAEPMNVYVGIDIGSISTKMVLVDEDENVVLDIYRKTRGEPIEAVQHLFRALRQVMEDTGVDFHVLACGTTGSGRKLIGAVVCADMIANEITAHVRGTLKTSPGAETVFEIGGQDSKFISLQDGRAHDSNMNYVCAAGTGSFIEEQARKLGHDIRDIGDLVQGITPPRTSDRCTVFMEQDIFRLVREGYDRETVLAATMYSICQNYLNKVVGRRKIRGERIAFMGATARNKGLVAAFENLLEAEITVSPYCHVMGAYGVALLGKEARRTDESSRFRGFDLSERKVELTGETCALCQNHCTITQAEIEGIDAKPSWGYLCGREPDEKKARVSQQFDLFSLRDKLLKGTGRFPHLGPEAPQVGIPLSLTSFTYRPLWERFFSLLGYRPRFTAPTDAEKSKRGVSLLPGEFCYPVKVSTGHVAELLEDDSLRWIFVPQMVAEDKLEGLSNRTFCPLVQSHPAVLKSSLAVAGCDVSRILSSPVDFSCPENTTVRRLHQALGEPLGLSIAEIRTAWRGALEAQAEFQAACQREGRKALDEIESRGETAIVIAGRPYNTFDLWANLSLPRKIAQYGYRVIPIDFMPFSPELVPTEYKGVFWTYGQQIMAALDQVRQSENLFAIYLTNFCCGPDSFLLSYAEQVLESKPLLILTMDEHGADTGYITRLEAFLDVIGSRKGAGKAGPVYLPKASREEFLKRKIWLPRMHPFGTHIFAEAFKAFGYEAEALPAEDDEAFEIGRSNIRGDQCLPAIVTFGALLKKLRGIDADPSRHAFFMPTTSGPCRFGQYAMLHRMMLNASGYADLPILSPSSSNTYMGLEDSLRRRLWLAVLASDLFYKAGCRIRPYEIQEGETDRSLDDALDILRPAFADRKGDIREAIGEAIELLRRVPTHGDPKPLVGVVGEIYVRCNGFCNEEVVRTIETLGGEAWVSPISEWILYTSRIQKYDARERSLGLRAMVKANLKNQFLRRDENRLYEMAGDLLADRHEPPIESILEEGRRYLPVEFRGESILTLGRAVTFAQQGVDLIVNCSPFTCMHGAISDAISQEVSQRISVPIVNMAYDGEGGQNSRLEIFFANRIGAGANVPVVNR